MQLWHKDAAKNQHFMLKINSNNAKKSLDAYRRPGNVRKVRMNIVHINVQLVDAAAMSECLWYSYVRTSVQSLLYPIHIVCVLLIASITRTAWIMKEHGTLWSVIDLQRVVTTLWLFATYVHFVLPIVRASIYSRAH